MSFIEYPKQLYRKGWEDLSDTVVVNDADQEAQARADGFAMLSEQAGTEEKPAQAAPAKRGRKAASEQAGTEA